MPIMPDELAADESTARRVLALARSIAPCLGSLSDDSDDKQTAIAILDGVIAELPEAGSRRTRSMSRNGTSLTLAEIKTAFDQDARDSLRALCEASTGGLPLGSFPASGIGHVWPETYS